MQILLCNREFRIDREYISIDFMNGEISGHRILLTRDPEFLLIWNINLWICGHDSYKLSSQEYQDFAKW